MLSFKVYTKPPRLGGALLADWSFAVRGLAIETTQRGFGSCTAIIPLPKPIARWHYASLDGGYLVVSDSGMAVYEGRIEITETIPEGLALTALGYSRAYSDLTVSELWSTMSVAEWQSITKLQVANHEADRWAMDTNNRLYIAANGGDAHDTASAGGLTFVTPAGANRQITSVSFDYALTAPVGWVSGLYRFTTAFGFLTTPWALSGNGATQTGSQTLAITNAARLVFNLYRNQAPTTLGTVVAAGGVAAKVCTPGSMAGIVSGTRLAIGGLEPEEVDVTAVGATTFTADFRFAHTAADSVVPIWEGETGAINLTITNVRVKTTTSATVTSDEVVRHLIAAINAANPNWSSSLTHRAKSPGFDLKEYAYEGVTPADVLDELAALGGDGWLWSWRVWEDQMLIFDRIANGSRAFQVYGTPPISRDLGSLITRLVPRYTDANGVAQVAAVVINAVAERRYGLQRSAYFDAPTASNVDAIALAQAALIDRSIVNAFGDLEITKLWQNGRRVPLTSLRSGDTVQCIEFPATGNSETDKTRLFRVATTTYNHDARTLTISPEQRAPTIDSLLARRDVQGKNR